MGMARVRRLQRLRRITKLLHELELIEMSRLELEASRMEDAAVSAEASLAKEDGGFPFLHALALARASRARREAAQVVRDVERQRTAAVATRASASGAETWLLSAQSAATRSEEGRELAQIVDLVSVLPPTSSRQG